MGVIKEFPLFYKALLISILIHLLILSWAGSSLPFLAKRTQVVSSLDRKPDYRIVNLVELPPPPTVGREESLGRSQLGATAKIAKQAPSLNNTAGQKNGALSSSLAQTPAELSPFPTKNEDEPVEKMTVPSQQIHMAGPGLDPSSQDQLTDSMLPLEAEAEFETEAGLEDKVTPSASTPNLVKVFHTDPPYPRLARRRGWEGTVYLSIRITPEGQVHKVKIAQSSGYELLDRAALEAVRQWRYAWRNGQPATAAEETITVKIRFQLVE
jgi:TonB family protein